MTTNFPHGAVAFFEEAVEIMCRSRIVPLVLGLVLGVWCGLLPSTAAMAEGAASGKVAAGAFRILHEGTIPAPVEWAFDIRWLDDDSVVVAAGAQGVFRVGLDGDSLRALPGSRQVRYANGLAGSAGRIAAVAPFGLVARKEGGGTDGWSVVEPLGPRGTFIDVDLSGDRLLMLGGRRVPVSHRKQPLWAPEGGILFLSSFGGSGGPELRMTARSGAGARELARCHVLAPGAVRFLPGDRYAVVPGIQPGVFVYASDGKLLRAWESSPLDVLDSCDLGEPESDLLSRSLDRRIAFWQEHSLVEDVVPWGDWIAVLVRRPREGGASWELVPFGEDGPEPALTLPLQAASPGIRLRADVRNGRLALLLFDAEEGDDGGAAHPPRWVVLERR